MKTSGDKIAEALHDALCDSSIEDMLLLKAEVNAFKKTYRRSYDGVKKQPFCRKLLDAIEEAIDLADLAATEEPSGKHIED